MCYGKKIRDYLKGGFEFAFHGDVRIRKRIAVFSVPLLIAGACNTTLHSPTTETSDTSEENDSTEIFSIYNDSIDNILMHPSNISLYQMCSLVRDSSVASQKDSLFNYPIDVKMGKLKPKERILLDFIIRDKGLYRTDYSPIRQPFNPNFVLKFSKGKQCAYYLVSFGTGEIAITDADGHFKLFLMNDMRLMERWYNYVLSRTTLKEEKV